MSSSTTPSQFIPSLTLGIERLSPHARLPHKAHPSDACFDLCASEALVLEPGETGLVPLGLAFELKEGWEAQIRGRSGLASRGITVHFGTIDHLYRQEVKVILHNFSKATFNISVGDRIAQLSFAPVYPVLVVEATIISSARGGFGSTGLA